MIDSVTANIIKKLHSILEYTHNVRLIVKADMMLATVNSLRKSINQTKNFILPYSLHII